MNWIPALKKAMPTVLSVLAAGGTVATVVLAVRSTPKAIELIRNDSRKNHDGDPYAYTKSEAVKSCWKEYIPAAAVGVSTLACIFGANVLNRRQQASMAGAYLLLQNSYKAYQGKVRELFGAEAHRKVIESLQVEEAAPQPIHTEYLCQDSCLSFDGVDEEEVLFYLQDGYNDRYFRSVVSNVLEAEFHLNRNFVLRGYTTINEFYDFLGIDRTDFGDGIGWSDTMGFERYGYQWIDFNHERTVLDDGLVCYVITITQEPTADFLDPEPFPRNLHDLL